MAIFPELIAAGLGCVPLSGYYLTAPAEQGFLLGFTSREPEVIDRAVRRFAEILNERGESIHILLSS